MNVVAAEGGVHAPDLAFAVAEARGAEVQDIGRVRPGAPEARFPTMRSLVQHATLHRALIAPPSTEVEDLAGLVGHGQVDRQLSEPVDRLAQIGQLGLGPHEAAGKKFDGDGQAEALGRGFRAICDDSGTGVNQPLHRVTVDRHAVQPPAGAPSGALTRADQPRGTGPAETRLGDHAQDQPLVRAVRRQHPAIGLDQGGDLVVAQLPTVRAPVEHPGQPIALRDQHQRNTVGTHAHAGIHQLLIPPRDGPTVARIGRRPDQWLHVSPSA